MSRMAQRRGDDWLVLFTWHVFFFGSLILNAPGTEALKFIGKLDVFATAYLGFSMDFNCTTDDPTASVALLHNQGSGPLTERPLNPNKLILNGQVFTVLNIAISDGGQYVCRATDQSGTTITSSRLFRVLQRAQLPKQFGLVPNKALIIIMQGHNQSIICQALQEGFPFDLTWEKQTSAGSYVSVDPSMVKRDHQSNQMVRAVLRIRNAKLSDGGIYKCKVSVKHVSTFKLTSVQFKAQLPKQFGLVPNKPLIIFRQGHNQSIICQALQEGFPFDLTWEKQTSAGSYVNVDPSMVKRDQSNKMQRAILTVANAKLSDSGIYKCTVAVKQNSTFKLASVKVKGTSGRGGLKFSGKLDQFASAYLGYSMDFDCTTDDPTASVVLLHNEGSGPLTERPLTPNKLILDGQVFTVLNIAVSDGGQYACRATDQSGTTITSSRLYRVLQQAQLPKQFGLVPNKVLIIIMQGHNQSIICQALQEGFPFDLTWEKQTSAGSYVSVDPSMVKRDQSNKMQRAILTVANAKLSDSTIYKCTVTVKHKSTFRLTSVRVKGTSGRGGLKFIGKLDQFALAYLGYSMDFDCTTDDPTASVVLLHNEGSGPLIERPLTPHKLILDGQVFTVLNIAISDGGQYACRATDQSGTTITSSRLYRLLQQAQLPKQFGLVPNKALIIIMQGHNQSIICQALQEGFPFDLTWEKQTSAGSYVSVDPSMVKRDQSNKMQRAILTVANAKLSDSTTYKCTVTVKHKSTFRLTSVRVKGTSDSGGLKFIGKLDAYATAYLGFSMDFNCTTDELTASVALLHNQGFGPLTEKPLNPNKVILDGQVLACGASVSAQISMF